MYSIVRQTISVTDRETHLSLFHKNEWAVTEVTDAQTMTVRQTDSNQMQVWLCGIDAGSNAVLSDPVNKVRSQKLNLSKE
ncbi:MAG: hypothetical protein RMY64_34035 [Nostoc sp. DedQUE08]|uniref:hypothetical protein n=1 Tax=Nostoc sp. DedQUE08 TaxID=3075393 RepID=UPI002AD1FFE9|nr:hypothetical protein [Nostoc sp. DedQUE08]MDZ8070575.1 hypothetical protein [Nostoc sp. DedQUE08]